MPASHSLPSLAGSRDPRKPPLRVSRNDTIIYQSDRSGVWWFSNGLMVLMLLPMIAVTVQGFGEGFGYGLIGLALTGGWSAFLIRWLMHRVEINDFGLRVVGIARTQRIAWTDLRELAFRPGPRGDWHGHAETSEGQSIPLKGVYHAAELEEIAELSDVNHIDRPKVQIDVAPVQSRRFKLSVIAAVIVVSVIAVTGIFLDGDRTFLYAALPLGLFSIVTRMRNSGKH